MGKQSVQAKEQFRSQGLFPDLGVGWGKSRDKPGTRPWERGWLKIFCWPERGKSSSHWNSSGQITH